MLGFLREFGGPRATGTRGNQSDWMSRIRGERTFTVPSSSPVAIRCGEMYRTRFIGALFHTQCPWGCVLISGNPLVHGQSGIGYLRGPSVDCAALAFVDQGSRVAWSMGTHHRDFPFPTDQMRSPFPSMASPRHDLLDGFSVNL